MTREEIVASIRAVLAEQMNNTHLDGFGLRSRLNADLYLDSVLMLDLFLHLELKHGLFISEEMVTGPDIETVNDLATLLAGAETASDDATDASETALPDVHGEEYPDIKVHCFVSCLCDAVKAAGLDHRLFYFGVWDADFAVSKRHELLYHTPEISHDFFRRWFHRLYGVQITEWYDHSASKQANLEKLFGLVATRRPAESVMVMLDMFYLPERENKFNQNPFPHYLIVEATKDPEVWQVRDPDFRWEGPIARERLLSAIVQPSVAGGYIFDRQVVTLPLSADIRDYFLACFISDDNPLIRCVREIVVVHIEGRAGLCVSELKTALRELPVISIRKWAYEHGFAYFWRALSLPNDEFLHWCDKIEELAIGLKGLHFAILRLAETRDHDHAVDVFETLDRLDALEATIKGQLQSVFFSWCAGQGWKPASTPECRLAAR